MDINDQERHRRRMLRKKAVFDTRVAAAQDVRQLGAPAVGLVILDELTYAFQAAVPALPGVEF